MTVTEKKSRDKNGFSRQIDEQTKSCTEYLQTLLPPRASVSASDYYGIRAIDIPPWWTTLEI